MARHQRYLEVHKSCPFSLKLLSALGWLLAADQVHTTPWNGPALGKVGCVGEGPRCTEAGMGEDDHCTVSTQSAGPVCFLIFCPISIYLLASLVAGRRPQCNAGADQLGMYSTIPIHWNTKSAPASPGRSRVGPALYVFSLLVYNTAQSLHSMGMHTYYVL